jgi:hypothetical protein
LPTYFRFVISHRKDRARSAALAKTDGHHPEIAFGWGIRHDLDAHQEDKGLHGKDSIMAAMLDRIVAERAIASDSPEPLRPAQQR